MSDELPLEAGVAVILHPDRLCKTADQGAGEVDCVIGVAPASVAVPEQVLTDVVGGGRATAWWDRQGMGTMTLTHYGYITRGSY